MQALWKHLKSKAPLFLLSFLIVGSSWFVMFNHYTRAQGSHDMISTLENALLDFRFVNRGVKKPKANMGILAIDEKAIASFGRWPFSRRYYKEGLINLKKLGVKWIGFDAVFSDPEISSLNDVKDILKKFESGGLKNDQALKEFKTMEKHSPGDLSFADGIRNFENVILGYFYFERQEEVDRGGRKDMAFEGFDAMLGSSIQAVILPEGKELKDYPKAMKVHGIITNNSTINEAGKHFAFFSNEADNDAIIRWVTMVRIAEGNLIPSMALKTAAEVLNREILVEFDDAGIKTVDLINREDESDAMHIPIDPLGRGKILANHHGPSMTFRHFSLADAYYNTFTDEEKAALKDSVLLLGMTAIGINDQRPNPFDPTLDGVEVHASVIDNILNKDFLERPKSIYSLELMIILFIGLFFSPLLIYSRASYAGFFVGIFLVGYYFFDQYYWFGRGIWSYMGMPILEILTLFIVITLYKYVTEERERKKVKGAFAHYLSPDVINQVLENPEQLKLGGERRELTVFFSDVRGFTTISESLTPEQLCTFMNEYFTPMTDIILRSKGVLDKYIGDAIMAFWGAPAPLPNQADVAVNSCIQMLYALEKIQHDFKAKNFPKIDIGMGLNTGQMSVGNMGSDERFCYTVMGDSVNLGSRLEGLTKEYGIKIMISEFTAARLTNKDHLIRDLDDIRVKGKNEPIKVYHVLRPDTLKTTDDIRNLIGVFEEARKFYRSQDWVMAEKKFTEALKIFPEDGPSKVFIERLAEYRAQPKIENWDGVYTFTHK